ncbi:hypothetical protein JIQ42_04490 [Leishmania sp. Namibia]|uniref:hypothetical protein n=1 Tax=Leishmania sp. Namibia TaxID=2802991 RepID=UPI001B46C139|nr:hypothetical protein JIQ42_04490 [Leishmania sp. Namibia]
MGERTSGEQRAESTRTARCSTSAQPSASPFGLLLLFTISTPLPSALPHILSSPITRQPAHADTRVFLAHTHTPSLLASLLLLPPPPPAMFGGPYRPRVLPVPARVDARLEENAANSVAGNLSGYPALQRPADSIQSRTGVVAPSPAADSQLPVRPCGILWNSPCGARMYRSPPGHQYHDDEVPPSFSMAPAASSTLASRRYQQLAAQHLYGAARSITAGAPSPSTPVARCSGGAVTTTPSSILRFTDRHGRPLPTGHESDSLPHEARRGSGSPALGSPLVSSSRENDGAIEECSETNEAGAASTSAMAAGVAVPSSSAQGCGNAQPICTIRQASSARKASEFSPTPSQSSVTAPSSSATAAVTVNDRLRSCGSATWCERQQQQQQRRSRSLPSRFAAPATSVAAKRPPPLRRTAQWAVRLIEDFVAQVALQQESVAAAPVIVSSCCTTTASGRKATASGRDAAITTTVADLTATFLASRYGALQWRPILHEFAACLHRYRRLSPACAVFREYFIHVDRENLRDFYTFCRLYAACDIQRCSTVETRRVALAATTAASTQTIVSRRYVGKWEVVDRLQHMLRRVSLSEYAPRLFIGAAGGALGCDASGDGPTSRQSSRRLQYRYARHPPARTTMLPQRRYLTAEEIRWVKRAVLGWMEEAALKCTGERSSGAGGPYEDDGTEDGMRCEAAGAEFQRVAFDCEGHVDAYALLQATLEAVKLVCRAGHSSPERCEGEAGQVDGAPDRCPWAQQQWLSVGSTSRTPQPQRELTPPSPQAYTRPAEAAPPSPQSQHHSSVQSFTQSVGGDDRSVEALYVRERPQEPASRQPRTPVSTGVAAARVPADDYFWSPSRDSVVSPGHNSGRSSSRLSPRRQVPVAAAEEHRRCSSARAMEQPWLGRKESEAEGCRGRASHAVPYHDYGYRAQLQGDELWIEAQEEAAAASLRRDRCWRDHYPRTYTRLQLTPSPRSPTNSARAARDTFACSSPSATATIDAIDAELRRRQARSCDANVSSARQMTANSAHLSPRALAAPGAVFLANPKATRCAAPSADGLPPPLFSPFAPSISAGAYPSRIHPAAAKSPRSATPAPRKTDVESSTPAGASLGTLSPRITAFSPAAKVNATCAGPHVSHKAVPAKASDTVLLTKEEQAMLNQLEIALRRLDTQHQRNHATTISAADVATASAKTYV